MKFFGYEIRSTKRPRPSDWDDFWFERQPYESLTGTDVTEDIALTYSAVYACVKVISEDLASLPLIIYRRKDRGKERATDHQLYYLLHDSPNPEMTSMQFRETLQGHLLTWGNAYAEIERTIAGEIKYLWPLNPGKMTVKRPEKEIIYEYIDSTGQKRQFPQTSIFHISGYSPNGLVGYSPISLHREAIACGLSGMNWQATNYKNGSRLQLVFVHPAQKGPSDEGRKYLREELRKEYGGTKGKGIGVTFEGMEPKPISMTARDAEFIESRKYTRTEICAIFRVPPHKIMDLERATFSNIEHQALEYVVDAIRPWAVRWEQAINMHLLNGSAKFFAEHLLDGLLRGDTQSRYAAYGTAIDKGWMNANEVREKENLNPYPGGDVYLRPLNMTTVTGDGNAPAGDELKDEKEELKLKLLAGRIENAG